MENNKGAPAARPTGARRAPVVAFFAKSAYSVSGYGRPVSDYSDFAAGFLPKFSRFLHEFPISPISPRQRSA